MTWIYRDAGPWGAGVGRKLTVLEGDGNTWETQQRIEALEAIIPVPRGVLSVTVNGSQWSMTLQDGSVLGPFTMPAPHFRPRGDWTPNTSYVQLDLVVVPGIGMYVVYQNHTSGASFNPDLTLNGSPVYRQIISTSILSSVSTISSGTHVPTPQLAGQHMRCTNASGCVITLPSYATQPIPIRSVYNYEQVEDGPVVFVAENASTIVNKPPTRDSMCAEKFAVASAIKVGTDEWTLAGYLAESEEEPV